MGPTNRSAGHGARIEWRAVVQAGGHESVWAAFPGIGALVHARRYDEALAELYSHAERAPADRSVTQAIERVREAMADAALAQLGPEDAVPRTTGVRAGSGELGADERYLLGLIDGVSSIAQLVRRSTLGRHRTSRALVWLAKHGMVEVPHATARLSPVRTSGTLTSVLVADENATQASLVRTMLRVTLGRAVAYHTATTAADALAVAARERPGLVVLDFRLPGRGDGIETLRAIRELPELHGVPAALIVQRVEEGYVRARLPVRAEILLRPIDRASLDATLKLLVTTAR